MTQTTARPAQLAPVRIGGGTAVHMGSLSWITGPNGEARYVSYCPVSKPAFKPPVAGEAIAEEITCKSCLRQADAESLERAADTAEAILQAARPARIFDQHDECIGCGADGGQHSATCSPDCGFETGVISAAIVLRATA